MDFDNIGGAITSYLLAFSAIAFDAMVSAGIVGVLGALLLVVRLCYEGLRLWRYIKKGETTKD